MLILITIILLLLGSLYFGFSLITATTTTAGNNNIKWSLKNVKNKFYIFKFYLFAFLLYIRNRRTNNNNNIRKKRYDIEEYRTARQLECPKILDMDDSIDSVYFFCKGLLESSSVKSDIANFKLIIRLARRKDRNHEFWMWLIIDGEQKMRLLHQLAPNVYVSDGDSESWSFPSGLRIRCERPNQYWTIRYCGWMKKENTEENIHVDLKLNYRAFTNVVDSHQQTSAWLSADAIANEIWSRSFFNELKEFRENKQTHYEQWGTFDGRLNLERNNEWKVTKCHGYRDHSFGQRNWNQYKRYGAIFGHFENGTTISLGAVCCRKTLSHIRYGYLITPFGDCRLVTWHNFNLKDVFQDSSPSNKYHFSFLAGGTTYELFVEGIEETKFYLNGGKTTIVERFTEMHLNGLKGLGVNEFCISSEEDNVSATTDDPHGLALKSCVLPSIKSEKPPELVDFCIFLDDVDLNKEVLNSRWSGGKGSQLALLNQLARQHSDLISIPKGFVITTRAYQQFVENNDELKELLNDESMTRNNKTEIGDVSHQIYDLLKSDNKKTMMIPDAVRDAILMMMDHVFGTDWTSTVKVAVRSSSIDEDGVMSSSAGQMDTILGVLGEENLLSAVVDCWASLYSETAVQYRLQNGLNIVSEMAVVVMEMVPVDKSGVLFTADPSTSDMSRMVINSSYGLGEAVVSSKCEPDTVILDKMPLNTAQSNNEANISIVALITGSKKVRIDMKDDDSGVIEREAQDSDCSEFSITDEEIIKLGKVGLLMEKYFGNPRDIEWGIVTGTNSEEGKQDCCAIHLFQCRPITSLDMMTDDDVMHEYDSALSYSDECLTSANIGEMMPKSVTPLTWSIFVRSIDRYFQDGAVLSGQLGQYLYPIRYLPTYCNQLFINIHCLGLYVSGNVTTSNLKGMFLAILGRVLDKPTANDIVYFTGMLPSWRRFLNLCYMIYNKSNSFEVSKLWEKKLRAGYKIRPQNSSKCQMEVILSQLNDYYMCWNDTILNTSQSATYSLILTRLVEYLNKKSNLDTKEICGKVATALSSCTDVYSADVPRALQNMVHIIKEDSHSRSLFETADDQVCLDWLKEKGPEELRRMYMQFMEMHGHRCVREAEFRETSWRREPIKIVSVIKAMVKSKTEKRVKKEMPLLDAVEFIAGESGILYRILVKMLLSKTRQGVGRREWGKSISIDMCERFKLGFLQLASLLQKEGVLSDPDLIYFLTLEELDDLVQHPYRFKGAFSHKALQRRRVLEQRQMAMQMPEVVFGLPEDRSFDETDKLYEDRDNEDLVVRGLPVSPGLASGTARVISTLKEAQNIEPGNILIVPYTDVGWTPYFPMLAGLVTELGGMLSHGAVVAREYGLPCVVACRGATQLFSTGDKVALDGAKGTVSRQSPASISSN